MVSRASIVAHLGTIDADKVTDFEARRVFWDTMRTRLGALRRAGVITETIWDEVVTPALARRVAVITSEEWAAHNAARRSDRKYLGTV